MSETWAEVYTRCMDGEFFRGQYCPRAAEEDVRLPLPVRVNACGMVDLTEEVRAADANGESLADGPRPERPTRRSPRSVRIPKVT